MVIWENKRTGIRNDEISKLRDSFEERRDNISYLGRGLFELFP